MSTIPDRNRPVALITGGRRGIGRGIAWALAASGFDLVINDVVEDSAVRETLDGIEVRTGRGVFVVGDIGDLDTHQTLLDRAWSEVGAVDCLVNNAGVSTDVRGDLLDLTPKSYDRVMGGNQRPPLFLAQPFCKNTSGPP